VAPMAPAATHVAALALLRNVGRFMFNHLGSWLTFERYRLSGIHS